MKWTDELRRLLAKLQGQDVEIDLVFGTTGDPLDLGFAKVFLPSMTVSGMPDEPYTLTPQGGGAISITDSTGLIPSMTGTLGVAGLSVLGYKDIDITGNTSYTYVDHAG